jgi:hypothetical protein
MQRRSSQPILHTPAGDIEYTTHKITGFTKVDIMN